MRFKETVFENVMPIDGYGPGFFRVGGQVFDGGILVFPNGVKPWQGYEDTEHLLAAALQLDVLFVGTGDETAFLPTGFRDVLEAGGLHPDPMATAAACRTYNVLAAEGRRVGAALLPVSGT